MSLLRSSSLLSSVILWDIPLSINSNNDWKLPSLLSLSLKSFFLFSFPFLRESIFHLVTVWWYHRFLDDRMWGGWYYCLLGFLMPQLMAFILPATSTCVSIVYISLSVNTFTIKNIIQWILNSLQSPFYYSVVFCIAFRAMTQFNVVLISNFFMIL